ncbi:MAG: 1-hydroxycarotenoid 3,4-desaturase CrtD [Ferruginibacter sp.]
MPGKKVIVIGSGIAGLAIAIRLAVNGFDVTVFEKNTTAGGKLSLLEKDGYRFDMGPSLFTQPQLIEELFTLATEDIANRFSYKNVPIACQYFFPNGKRLTAFSDPEKLDNEMNAVFNEKKNNLNKYLKASKNIYIKIASIFLNYSLHKKSTWFNSRLFKALAALRPPYLFRSLNDYNKKIFQSPELVQVFNRYATYNGSNPYKAPAMLAVISHLEYNEGTWYPRGGMKSIAKALYELALLKGVRFNFNKPVQKIIHYEGTAHGVVADNENVYADVVVSNSDVYFTYKNLLHQLPKAKKLLKQERSSSALIFYWGISKQFKELQLHNIFFSKNYEMEFEYIFNKKQLQPDPTVYINITSKEETAHAPAGCENWFVMINVCANTGQDWNTIKLKARKIIINKINENLGIDIEPLIQIEETLDPVGIETNTGSFMGSLYGTSSNSKLAAFFRHPNFSRHIKNLYFCGGTVHPGGGIPLCLQSAKITANLILKNKSMNSKH